MGSKFDDFLEERGLLEKTESVTINKIMSHLFDHIPELERKKKWFLLLQPLLHERLKRNNPSDSLLIQTLSQTTEMFNWKTLKSYIEKSVEKAINSEKIFSRIQEVKHDPNPDNPIEDMFAELKAIPYLVQKGFSNLQYFRQKGSDFHAEFERQTFYIEVTCIHGSALKTFPHNPPHINSFEPDYQKKIDTIKNWDSSRKLTDLFKSKYEKKEKQLIKRDLNLSNCLILIFTNLMDTHEGWFEHVKINGLHPLQNFVNTQEIATVIHGASIYEPESTALNGYFGKLNPLAREKYSIEKF